jgi:hypothetical protein
MNKIHKITFSIVALLFICLPGMESEVNTVVVTERKSCPAKQESVELCANIVSVANIVSRQLNALIKSVLDVQVREIIEIQKYVDGDKDCILYAGTKKERIAFHTRKQKIEEKLNNLMTQLDQLVHESAQL